MMFEATVDRLGGAVGVRVAAATVSAAVQAGIAAAAAACVFALGQISRGEHRSAERMLRQIADSDKAAADMSRLLAIKTMAQDAGGSISARVSYDALDRARRLVRFAERQRRR